jgi:hypothetical protein
MRASAGAFLAALILASCVSAARAQQQPASSQLAVSNQLKDVPLLDTLNGYAARPKGEPEPAPTTVVVEEEFIKPSRPSVANPAEIQRAGVLQVEFGYDGLFRSDEFRDQQAAPLTLRFAATSRLLLELNLDAVKSQKDEGTRRRDTGVGDTRLGFQFVALEDTEAHPALAFAYNVKLPTASEERQLGTGRFDHKFTALLSKQFGQKTDLDFNGALLINGREGEPGWEHGGLGAVSVSRELADDWGVEGELVGTSLDDVLPRGLYALGSVHRKLGSRARIDWGARFGLFGGITFGVGGYK